MNNSKLARNVPHGYALRVFHVHDPETLTLFADHGKPPKYVTRATIYRDVRHSDGKLNTDVVTNPPLVVVDARCSHRDSPSRKVGYHLAVTRALRTLSTVRRSIR